MRRVPGPGRARITAALTTLLCVAAVAASCSGDDAATPSTTTASTTTTAANEHDGHALGIVPGTVADIRELGPGPTVGDRWEVPVGLNVCGRFLESPAGGPVGGISAGSSGIAVVEPTDEATAGHAATVGGYAEAAGVALSTGELRLPEGIVPSEMQVGDTDITLDGATFRTGDRCGDTPAEVQVWVYSAEAVTSGEDIYTVVEDPEQIPFAEDGMAVVIALVPESSLPTLPPSALGLG